MDHSTDRLRFKDKIIDNISKAIKSIQELLYYQSKDPVLSGSVEGLTLCNADWPCHKLCENLDHALLHGLKKVDHGYWQVVKQLSHKQMVKEIDVLTNVTTDLGRGRAWLYVSLNEGLLESYIRLLCGNDKLVKNYYSKDALMLDEDRMNILLTHTSGLDFVRFQLEYDVPYLDLNAYPPRTYTSSEPEDYIRSVSPACGRSRSFVSEPQVRANSTDPTGQPLSDSDSASVASSDGQSQSEIVYHMKASTISSDSGCPTESVLTDAIKQDHVPSIETILSTRQQAGTPTDRVSLCSVGSSGDPDRHQRLENLIHGGDTEEDGIESIKVTRLRSKKGGKPKKKKHITSQRNDLNKNKKTLLVESRENSNDINCEEPNEISFKAHSQNKNGKNNDSEDSVISKAGLEYDGLTRNVSNGSQRTNSACPESYTGQSDNKMCSISIPKLDSGVDISDLAVSGDKSFTSNVHNNHGNNLVLDGIKEVPRPYSDSPHTIMSHNSIQAQIESKIAELCSVDISGHLSQKPSSVEIMSGDTSQPSFNVLNPDAEQFADINGLKRASKSPPFNNNQNLSEHSKHNLRSQESRIHNSVDSISNTYCQIPVKQSSINPQKNTISENQVDHNHARVMTEIVGSTTQLLGSSHETEDGFDFYSSYNQGTSEPRRLSKNISVQSANQLQDYMDYILQPPDSPPMDSKDRPSLLDQETDLSLSLDNNTKLQLMLDIFSHEDEKLLKMFATRDKHTEGDSGVVFVLISDLCLYLLQYHQGTKKFVLQSSALLLDLLFISTGINEQTLNIESRDKNNQKQRLWLTPGYQALTRAIVECLTDAVQVASEFLLPKKSRFSVESEVPLQNIALRKYVSTELPCEAQDVMVSDYSLVFWEDPSSASHKSHDIDAAYKEGTLLIRTQDPLKTYVWKPVYVVLKNSMLCVSNKKSDPRPHTYLGLGGDQCVGCRSTSLADREYCVELILAQGGSWFLAAASQAEISEWRHALCLAVSQGSVDNSMLTNCIPCGAVLSCNHLFLCHEDLHTKLFRTLGRAQLEDITGIAMDGLHSTYCIIEFESQEPGVSSNQWVFYFSSVHDLERYKMSLNAAWKEIYQIDLPILPVSSVSLRHHCSNYADQLRQQLALR